MFHWWIINTVFCIDFQIHTTENEKVSADDKVDVDALHLKTNKLQIKI